MDANFEFAKSQELESSANKLNFGIMPSLCVTISGVRAFPCLRESLYHMVLKQTTSISRVYELFHDRVALPFWCMTLVLSSSWYQVKFIHCC